jgi:hypothetical protein
VIRVVNRIVVEGAAEMYRILLSCSAALLLSAPVSAGGTPPERPTPPATGVAPPARIPDIVQVAPEAPAAELVPVASLSRETRRAVVEDAARRFKVSENDVVLTRAERLTWPNGALGCPEPGRMYTQALVSGYRLVAKTAAGELIYHADQRGNIASCAGRSSKPPGVQLHRGSAKEPVTGPPPAAPREN